MSKFNKKPLKKSYFKEAMNYFREERETEKIAFLYVSDDMEWGKTELKKLQKKHKDIYFEGKSIFRKKKCCKNCQNCSLVFEGFFPLVPPWKLRKKVILKC